MYAPSPEMNADQVLQAFHHDAPFLFLGAAIAAVGLVAAVFSAIRRKLDPVLIYFALFAVLYGLRLWIRSNLMGLAAQGSLLYPRFSDAIDFIVPIPAFFFFKAAGLLRRQAKIAGYVLGIVLGSLALAPLGFGRQQISDQIANVLVIAAVIVVVVRAIRSVADNQDLVVIRRGGLIFAAFIFWENIRSVLGLRLPNIEPIGFVAFLASLGYVAARQTLQRDLQLSKIQKELEVAKQIQLSILPAAFPDSANFRVAARYVPVTSVAGDFYDFIVADDTHAGLLIADVSGPRCSCRAHRLNGESSGYGAVRQCCRSRSVLGRNERRSLRKYSGPVRNRGLRSPRLAIAGVSLLGGRASADAPAARRESARNHREWFDPRGLRLCHLRQRSPSAGTG
jgi:sigma-B regulation protein RsbU (phosphoserine phosphatase)